ncbi:Uncharacterized protein FWK35_00016181 [Aphis craccivora]|uniref:Uncharacterized protein n=1 Tax=Aphis craccivora TaxID=307492 RepID=A0A6G0YLB7_APHCR|nr:Uncharacterized protein FWK35_00016181 [Aphis craccivora]
MIVTIDRYPSKNLELLPSDITCFKYATITSVNVERSLAILLRHLNFNHLKEIHRAPTRRDLMNLQYRGPVILRARGSVEMYLLWYPALKINGKLARTNIYYRGPKLCAHGAPTPRLVLRIPKSPHTTI